MEVKPFYAAANNGLTHVIDKVLVPRFMIL